MCVCVCVCVSVCVCVYVFFPQNTKKDGRNWGKFSSQDCFLGPKLLSGSCIKLLSGSCIKGCIKAV